MKKVIAALALVFMLAPLVVADTIILKDGQSLQGTLKSASSTALVVEVKGESHTIPIESVNTIAFSARQAPPPVQSAPAPASVTVNAGTRLMIRTTSNLETGRVHSGDKFTATLDADFAAAGVVVAPKGSTIYGRVQKAVKAGRLVGRAKLVLELTDVIINNQLLPIVTDQFGVEGDRQGTLKKVAAGALTGGMIDGNDGAETGAKVGVGLAIVTKGKQIHIPGGTVLEFRLTQPVTVGR